jgi:YVTN family beta-propeller protein
MRHTHSLPTLRPALSALHSLGRFLFLLVAASAVVTGCAEQTTDPFTGQALADTKLAPAAEVDEDGGVVVVANRGSGDITIINAATVQVIDTRPLPGGPNAPEPMYVVHVPNAGRVFVGDRANNRVAVFGDDGIVLQTTAPAGSGVFHMWADPQGRQLWINNDIDNTTTVLDPGDLTVLATVPTPADLVSQGGKPHDVVVGPMGKYAYVSVIGVAGANDYVVQFSTRTFAEIGRAAVGKDPHLSLTARNEWLYVPCQNTDEVVILDRVTMAHVTNLAVPGAHGAGMTRNGQTFYTANLPGGGANALFAIDTRTNSLVGSPVDSPYPVPHNIALTNNGKRLFLTHSGGIADKVTVYGISQSSPMPVYETEVTVGLNPFGLAFVRRES